MKWLNWLPFRLPASMLGGQALARHLVPWWAGKWEHSILGKYVGASEQRRYADLIASGRWNFSAVPSVRRTGITIELRGRSVTDTELESLPDLPSLNALVLTDCSVTDASLKQLGRFPQLECLVLSGTRVTDAGVDTLCSLQQLQTLDVERTTVTDAALQQAGLLDKTFSLAEVVRSAAEERSTATSDLVDTNVEIVELNRRLAAMRPEACLPDLAVSLNNLGWGRHSERAVAALQEAVEINRRLLDSEPSQDFRGALATSLGNLGSALQQLEQWEQAAEETRQSVELHRQLSSDPNNNAELAVLLKHFGDACAKAGRNEDAARAFGEAADLYREGVKAKPKADMLKSWLVEALDSCSAQLHLLGRNEEALAHAEEAVHHARSLARTWMGPKDLQASLNRLATILASLNRHEEAAAAKREAETTNER